MATTYSPVARDPAGHFAGDVNHKPISFPLRAPACDPNQMPPPNPTFSFPAQIGSEAGIAIPRAISRRPRSAIESPSNSFDLNREDVENEFGPTPLPAFSFNPGASLPTDAASPSFLSASSPQSPRPMPSAQRPGGHGHRRGGSEFVGGRLREGNSIAIMSTSPTKPDGGFTLPNFNPPPRRGHRRGLSSAISTNELPILLPPPDLSLIKGSSAPTSPTNFDRQTQLSLPTSEFQPSARTNAFATEVDEHDPQFLFEDASPKELESKSTALPTRPRVGFSDTLEFIPRPLSLVSSDTSSITITTAKPGHAVSDSISSIVATGGLESPVPLSRSSTRDNFDLRPNTAGAILENIQPATAGEMCASPKRRNSIPTLADIAETTSASPPLPSPNKASKRWTFFGREPFSPSLPKGRPASSSSLESNPGAASSSSSEHGSEPTSDVGQTTDSRTPKKGPKKSKKSRKVKGWAGAILHGKSKVSGKNANSKEARPPTPPAPPASSDEDDETPNLEIPIGLPTPPPSAITIEPILGPLRTEGRSEEPTSPMIDLDAALGPFNTPLPYNPEWEAAQQAAGNASKRRLHSAQGMKGFTGLGMHYHRRAESAPDLPPFESGRAFIHRFGSSSTMADVFEEEDEDDANEAQNNEEASIQSQTELMHAPSRVNNYTNSDSGEATPPAVEASKRLQDGWQANTTGGRPHSSGQAAPEEGPSRFVRAEHSKTSLHDDVIIEEPPSFSLSCTSASQSRRSSNDSAASPWRFPSSNKSLPTELNILPHPNSANLPVHPYSISQASSYPSPRSPASTDAQRISTAPSSINDGNSFQSLLMGEPGPEVRLSVDYDIPSLTSDTSTTRESSFVPTQRMSQPSFNTQRPMSVSSAAFGRRRASLVSLGRLISSSHGERSKLSMEVTLDPDSTNRKSKKSKTRRLGQMMQFWKPAKGSG